MNIRSYGVLPETVLGENPIIPVLVIEHMSHVVPLAEALFEGGITLLEVTLRTPIALKAIERIVCAVPGMRVGAGTVLNAHQLKQSLEAGASFAISPGLTPLLLHAGLESQIPLIPGVSSASELMIGMEYGYQVFKFFPALSMGGAEAIKSMLGPFPNARFCPTGGINYENFLDYLALPNVICVGGSWIVPKDALERKDWKRITDLCALALSRVRSS